MLYKRVFIILYNFRKNIHIECYTDDGISYIVIMYRYKFLKTVKKVKISNRLNIILFLELFDYKDLYINVVITEKNNNKRYVIERNNKYEKINTFFELTNIDPPPPYNYDNPPEYK